MAQVRSKVKWRSKPAAHDYPAASAYLSLLVADPALLAALVDQLRAAPVVHFKAKDLLRASQLPLLSSANAHVALDLRKIRKRLPLSPVLLVRGDLVRGFPLQVADGYHRVCASHLVDEDTEIPCRLIDLPAAPARPRTTRAAASLGVLPEVVVPEVVVPEVVVPGVATTGEATTEVAVPRRATATRTAVVKQVPAPRTPARRTRTTKAPEAQ